MRAADQDGMIIRERRFAQVPDALIADPAVTDFAVRLWCRLDRYAGEDGHAFPHVDLIAKDMRVSPSKVDRGLRCLIDTGWTVRRRRGFSNVVDTCLTDEPVPPSRRRHTGRSEASPQVTPETSDLVFPETSDLVFPETSDLTFPKKESHLKENHLKERPCGRGGVSSHQSGDAASMSPPEDRPSRSAQPVQQQAPPPGQLPPRTCLKHAAGNPHDEPCRACRDAREAHDQARAERSSALAKQAHDELAAQMRAAERAAWRPARGTLRSMVAARVADRPPRPENVRPEGVTLGRRLPRPPARCQAPQEGRTGDNSPTRAGEDTSTPDKPSETDLARLERERARQLAELARLTASQEQAEASA